MELYEGFYKENRFLVGLQQFEQSNFDVRNLNLQDPEAKIKKYSDFDSFQIQTVCDLDTELSIFSLFDQQKTFTYNSTFDVKLKGKLVSEKCNLEMDFEAQPMRIDIINVLLFLSVNILALMAHLVPLLKMIKTNNFQKIQQINANVLLMSIIFDFTMVTLNTSYSIRVVMGYFEFLSILTFYFIISMIIKLKLCLILFYNDLDQQNLTFQERQTKKFHFILKFLLLSLISMFFGFFILVKYYYILLLFTFPFIQIIYNSCHQIRKNCFHWDFHTQFFLPQIVYPLTIRGFTFEFMEVKEDYNFAYLLITLSFTFLFLMYLQRHMGSAFFLPKFLRPIYYQYERKLEGEKDLIEVCAICMEELTIVDEEESESDIYLETPCGHKFHQNCLSKWMEQKFLCPLCRTEIPPYDN